MTTLILTDTAVTKEGGSYVIEQGDQRISLTPAEAKKVADFIAPKKEFGSMEGFTEFWKAYPRKDAKHPASLAWARTKASTALPAILADVDRRKGTKQWREGFIPHASTYLNQRRWEDQVSEPSIFDGVV